MRLTADTSDYPQFHATLPEPQSGLRLSLRRRPRAKLGCLGNALPASASRGRDRDHDFVT